MTDDFIGGYDLKKLGVDSCVIQELQDNVELSQSGSKMTLCTREPGNLIICCNIISNSCFHFDHIAHIIIFKT